MFNPFFMPYQYWTRPMLARRFPVNRVNRRGIAVLPTIGITVDTTATTVTYQLCPWRWRQLCNEGLFILRVANAAPASAAAYTVQISTSSSSSNTTATTTTSHTLLNGSGTPMTSAEIINGNRYLVYYNKCDGIFQVVNHIPATAAAATTATTQNVSE